jgi:hypothetical protein
VLGEHGDGIDHGGYGRAFHPLGGHPQRVGEDLTAAVFVPFRQDDHGQSGLDQGAEAIPPG